MVEGDNGRLNQVQVLPGDYVAAGLLFLASHHMMFPLK